MSHNMKTEHRTDTGRGAEGTPSFASRWRGKFRAAERDGNPRYDALAKKYLTTEDLSSPPTEEEQERLE